MSKLSCVARFSDPPPICNDIHRLSSMHSDVFTSKIRSFFLREATVHAILSYKSDMFADLYMRALHPAYRADRI